MRGTTASLLCATALLGALRPSAGWAQSPTSQPTTDANATTTTLPAVAPPQPLRTAPWLGLKELSFDLGFDGRYERREVRSQTRGVGGDNYRQLNETRRFDETIGLQAAGHVVDERTLLYDVAARYGLSQEHSFEKRPGLDQTDGPDGDLLQYDFKLTAFPAGKVSATAYAAQLDDRVQRPFLPSLDRRRERYGAALSFNDAVLPMRLSFDDTFEQLDSPVSGLQDDEDRRERTLRYEATWQPSEYHALRLDYEYGDRREKYSGSQTRFDDTRNYVTLDHLYLFGDDRRSRAQTILRFQDETGDLARDMAELAPQFRLQHTESLATTYKGQYLKESFEGVDSELWRGDVGLIHEWAKTLTSSLDFYGLQQDLERNADLTEWGGSANFAFSKENDLGRLSSNLTYAHTRQDSEHGRTRGVVLRESVTLRDPLPAYLAQRNVELASVVVTDEGRTRTYLRGRDYVVYRIGQYTALQRLLTGQIANLQTVTVSYLYRTFDEYELRRDRLDFRLQQDFKIGLTPYYAFSVQDEDINQDDFLGGPARNINRHRIGATYRRKRWSVGGEYEYYDDAIDPYQAFHLNGDVLLLDLVEHQLNARTTFSRFYFDGQAELEERDTTYLDLGLAYRALLTRNFEANASATYRFENDSLRGETNGVDLKGSLSYQLGLFSVLFEVEYGLLDLPGSSDDNFAVWLKLRRDIPVLASGKPR